VRVRVRGRSRIEGERDSNKSDKGEEVQDREHSPKLWVRES